MTFRSEALRRAIHELPCAECNIVGYSQVAHSNSYRHGKGRGLKASDAATFPLCCDRPGIQGCHSKFDQYILYTRAQVENKTDEFIAKTYIALIESGALRVSK